MRGRPGSPIGNVEPSMGPMSEVVPDRRGAGLRLRRRDAGPVSQWPMNRHVRAGACLPGLRHLFLPRRTGVHRGGVIPALDQAARLQLSRAAAASNLNFASIVRS